VGVGVEAVCIGFELCLVGFYLTLEVDRLHDLDVG
jgi:hypothetical protein